MIQKESGGDVFDCRLAFYDLYYSLPQTKNPRRLGFLVTVKKTKIIKNKKVRKTKWQMKRM